MGEINVCTGVMPNENVPQSAIRNKCTFQTLFMLICFRLLHIKYPEQHADGYNSSVTREKRYEILTKDREIMTVVDLVKVLGNQDDIETYPIFSDRDSAKVSTIMLSE